MSGQRTRLAVGCMCGTSLDGLDAAMVRIEGQGLDLRAHFVRGRSAPLGPLQRMMRPIARGRRLSPEDVPRIGRALAEAHVALVRDLLGQSRADFISVHGQTLFHRPPLSWQAIDAMTIAHRLNTAVVYDLRGADLACGGQGAPITPIADLLLFADARARRTVVNLGGFINVTQLPAVKRRGPAALRAIRGGDVCACNQLLDEIARRRFGRPYDEDGRRALRGHVDARALAALVRLLGAQAAGGRSLGSGDEARSWIERYQPRLAGADMARTACRAIATALARHLKPADQIVVAGGGANNQALLAELRSRLSEVHCSDAFGVPGAYREAAAMAVLGALCQDGVPITLGQITGCRRPPVAGAWIRP